MKTKLFALLLALVLVLSCFAGCAKKTEPAPAPVPEPAAAPAPESAPEPAAEAPAEPAAAEAAPAEEAPAPAEEAPAEEPPAPAEEALPPAMQCVPAIDVTYPLEGENSITYWATCRSNDPINTSNYSYYCIPYAEQKTGVHIEFIEVSDNASTEQYQLMVASGDWPDVNPANKYYTGGLIQAYEDEVILDLLDSAYDYMPNFTMIFDQLDQGNHDLAMSEGKLLAFPHIADGYFTSGGLVTRGDWMDEQGISFDGKKITLEQFTDLLRVFKDAYGVECGFPSADGGFPMYSCFDMTTPCLISDGFMMSPGPTIFRYGDEVVSGWTVDAYRDYVLWFCGMVEEGLFQKVTEVEPDKMQQNSLCANGHIAVWNAAADKLDECGNFVVDPEDAGFQARALPTIVADEAALDEPNVWVQTPQLVTKGISISADSEKTELVCRWLNYFWTDEGTMLYNYGIEKTAAEELNLGASRDGGNTVWYGSYVMDENGEPQWTEMITNITLGGNAEKFLNSYTMAGFATSLQVHDRILSTFTQNALDAVELWTLEGEDERYYPAAITLSAEDNDRVNKLQADVTTYGAEQILLMLDGQKEINDENWSTYIETINNMGLEEIVEIYQAAYDAYIAE